VIDFEYLDALLVEQAKGLDEPGAIDRLYEKYDVNSIEATSFWSLYLAANIDAVLTRPAALLAVINRAFILGVAAGRDATATIAEEVTCEDH
jgi:hypothetical protein